MKSRKSIKFLKKYQKRYAMLWKFGHFVTLGKMTFWTYCHHGHNIFWAFYHPGHFVILGLNVIWAFWLWAICHTWAFCHLGHFNIQSNIFGFKVAISSFSPNIFFFCNVWFFGTQISKHQIMGSFPQKNNQISSTLKYGLIWNQKCSPCNMCVLASIIYS